MTFEVFTAVTIKNVVLWGIQTQMYFTGNTLSPLQSPEG
jgi:hypothetical protein